MHRVRLERRRRSFPFLLWGGTLRRRLLISIDAERDIVRHLTNSFRGVEAALPVLLEVIGNAGFRTDLFVEAPVARQYADMIRKARNIGSFVCCHGTHTDPAFATELEAGEFEDRLRTSRREVGEIIGSPPVVFREANFAVNSSLLVSMERQGFEVDCSVLPNRLIKKKQLRVVVDHRGAPSMPYHPGLQDHRVPGMCRLLEIPVTSNPFNPGGPIGTGFLNWRGISQTIAALKQSRGDPVTFLIHPWECVDFSDISPPLPNWVLNISRQNSGEFRGLLEEASGLFEASSVADVAEEYGVKVR